MTPVIQNEAPSLRLPEPGRIAADDHAVRHEWVQASDLITAVTSHLSERLSQSSKCVMRVS